FIPEKCAQVEETRRRIRIRNRLSQHVNACLNYVEHVRIRIVRQLLLCKTQIRIAQRVEQVRPRNFIARQSTLKRECEGKSATLLGDETCFFRKIFNAEIDPVGELDQCCR